MASEVIGDASTFCTDSSCRHIREIHDEEGCDICDCTRSADKPEYFAPVTSGEYLRRVLEAIQRETRPIEGHSDPGAIQDCWREVFETIDEAEAIQRERARKLAEKLRWAADYEADGEFSGAAWHLINGVKDELEAEAKSEKKACYSTSPSGVSGALPSPRGSSA